MSLWLYCGVPATEVAHRVGRGVAVLLKMHAHCIDGKTDAANRCITATLSTHDTGQDSCDDGTKQES